MENLTLVRSTAARKDQRLVIYNIEGRSGSVQFLSTLFGGNQTSQGNPPDKLTLSGTFAAPKKPETKEERKARLAAITPEQKIAKMELRLLKMKSKLVAAPAAAGATAPSVTTAAPSTKATSNGKAKK